MKFTEQEIDSLLASVEASLAKVESLSKADPDEVEQPAAEPKDDAPMAPPASPAVDQPPPAGDQPADQPPPAGDQPAEQPDQELSQEAQGEEVPLSDEELDQIYGSLDPQELERHYMAIRRHLQDAYAKAEMESKEEDKEKKEEDKEDKVEKSETAKEIEELKKKNAEQEQTLATLSKAIELLAQPKRKSIANIEYVKKSEVQEKPVSKTEIKQKLNEITKSSALTKSERAKIDEYCLFGKNEQEIVNIVKKFEQGGK